MLKALTRSRSADFHRATMLRLLIATLLLYWLWEPMRPIRHMTGEALSTAAEMIRR
jgi:hypothetical protein